MIHYGHLNPISPSAIFLPSFFFILSVPPCCMHAKLLESCLTLCSPTDCSPPGSSVHGILQARILEWVSISFSRGSSCSRGWTHCPMSPASASDSLPLSHLGSPTSASEMPSNSLNVESERVKEVYLKFKIFLPIYYTSMNWTLLKKKKRMIRILMPFFPRVFMVLLTISSPLFQWSQILTLQKLWGENLC